jgi:hypothetical protein
LATGEYTLAIDQPIAAQSDPTVLGTLSIGPSTRVYELPDLYATVNVTLTTEDNSEIALVGLAAAPQPNTQTNEMVVELIWKPAARITGNYMAFVHLLDPSGAIIAQSDAIPGGDHVTSRWLAEEIILDRHLLTLPPDVAQSEELSGYQIVAGLYDAIGMNRLTARTGDGMEIADGRVPLGPPASPLP